MLGQEGAGQLSVVSRRKRLPDGRCRLPKAAKSSDKSNAYVDLYDRSTRDIQGKWRAALATAMRHYAGVDG